MCSKLRVHETAQAGFTEGSHYEKSRPSYSDELVNHVIQSLHTGSERETRYDILELGARTGKFTRKILEKLKNPVRYVATEPSPGFLETFKTLSPDVETIQCDATNIPITDASVQNIVCAQCFHWFANEASLDEMTRILVPGGRIFFVWNNKDRNVEWVKAVEDALTLYYDDTPRVVASKWKNVVDNYKGLQFVEHKFFPGVKNMAGSKDFVIDHFTSIGVIARLDQQAKQNVKDEIRTILDQIFSDADKIHIPFQSEFYCTKNYKTINQ